jgi:hypothetical protein
MPAGYGNHGTADKALRISVNVYTTTRKGTAHLVFDSRALADTPQGLGGLL